MAAVSAPALIYLARHYVRMRLYDGHVLRACLDYDHADGLHLDSDNPYKCVSSRLGHRAPVHDRLHNRLHHIHHTDSSTHSSGTSDIKSAASLQGLMARGLGTWGGPWRHQSRLESRLTNGKLNAWSCAPQREIACTYGRVCYGCYSAEDITVAPQVGANKGSLRLLRQLRLISL